MPDARFEDGAGRPLRLRAEDADDLNVISTLLQDAVLEAGDISWMPRRRRFAVLLNRFRWEERGGPAERTRAVLEIGAVLRVQSQGVDPRERDLVLSLLCLVFDPGEDGAGRMRLILAGDGEIALDVECVDVALSDVTRPYLAPSGKRPGHDVD